jgi:hypothetical protein
VQHILALSRSAVIIRHWFEINLDDASMEHGARIEIRIEAANQRPSSPPSIARCGGPICSTGSRILRAVFPLRISIRDSTATSRLPGAGMPP